MVPPEEVCVVAADVLALALHWMDSDPSLTFADGDFNGDHTVNKLDLTILAQYWQTGGSSSSSSLTALATSLGLPASAIPEPATAGLLAALAATGLARRPRRRFQRR